MSERLKDLWEELIKKQPTNNDLRYIIKHVESLRIKAWQKLLAQNPTNDDLHGVIEYVKLLKTEACQKHLHQALTFDDLGYIIERVEPLRIAAEKMLKRPESQILKEMREISISQE